MNLPRIAVTRPIFTLMAYSALCLFGLFSFFMLPVDLMPNAAAGSLTIMIGVRGGLPPEDIENLVTKLVEESVSTAQHLRNVLSVSRRDRSVVTLTYEPGTDLSFASLEIQERLAKIKNKLPKDIEKPIVAHYTEGDYPVLILSLTSDKFSPEKLRELVDNSLKPKLTRVNGVANVEVGGGRERKILVEFYQDRLEAYQLPIRQVIDTIGRNNLNLQSGKTETKFRSLSVITSGQFKTIDELKKLVVLTSPQGSVIHLQDVADVKDFYLEAQTYARLNKKPTVSVYIQKENNTNTIRMVKRVKAMLERFKKNDLDPAINMITVTDQSTFIEEAMDNVSQSFTWGALMTWGVIFLFLKEWKHTSLVFLSVPIAVLITLGSMYLSHISLNVMTLSALALGIGMVVDSATVVLENILEKKKNALRHNAQADMAEVSVAATDELFTSLLGSTLTTVVVFLPIIFINQQVRILYSGLAFTITFSMLASLVVAMTVVPLLAGKIVLPSHQGYLPPAAQARLWDFLERMRAWVPPFFRRSGAGLTRLGKKIFPLPPDFTRPAPESFWIWRKGSRPSLGEWVFLALVAGVNGSVFWYAWKHQSRLLFLLTLLLFFLLPIWHWIKFFWHRDVWPQCVRFWQQPGRTFRHWCAQSVRHQKYISLLVAGAAAVSLYMYFFALEKDFLGSTEQNEFVIFVELPAGSRLDVSDKVVSDVERVLSETPEIKDTVKTAAARVEGWSSKVYVTLAPRSERSRSVQDVINDLRPKLADIGQEYDSFIYFSEPEASKEFFIDVFGPDYDKLRDLASAIAGRLEKVNGLADIKLRYKPGQPELQINVDKERAALFGFTVKDIAEDLHARIRGLRPTFFFTENTQYEVIARDKEIFRKSIEDIHALTTVSPDGTIIPIEQMADFKFSLTPSEVWRKDKQRVIQVSANREKLALSTAAQRSLSVLKGVEVPSGYYFQIGGDYVDMVQNEKEFRFAFLIMASLVFIVLASLFESYSQALLVMVTIPMALIGSIPLLYLTHTSATMSVFIGMIMLGGIVVSAAIILVEKMNQEWAESGNLKRAVLEASWVRLSPILNTSLTTIVDLVPMVLSRSESAQLWSPLALTVIGGASMSTFLTLFMVPALYYHMQIVKKKVQGYFSSTAPASTIEGPPRALSEKEDLG